jgi:hypothetical protein
MTRTARTRAAHSEYPLSHHFRLANRMLSKRLLCGVSSQGEGLTRIAQKVAISNEGVTGATVHGFSRRSEIAR